MAFSEIRLTCTTVALATTLTLAAPAGAQQVINNSLVVKGSICAGLDCPNVPNFGFDTLRLQENNLRINFEDTSVTAGFPTRDWRITANDSASGGKDRFSIEDVDANRAPFTIEGNAPANSLYVNTSGRIGLKTPTPVLDLHLRTGNTPAIRLEQDGSSGFTPQTWDLAGNETNFFLRDVTAGSRLPIRSFPGAPTNSLVVAAAGVGIGIAAPDATLHVSRGDGTTKLTIQETSATQATREMLLMQNFGGSFFTLKNTQSNRDWFFTHENAAAGRFIVTASTNPSQGMFLSPNGNMTIGGVLTQNSDKNAKMAIEPVDTAEILDKVAALPVSAWTYKDDTVGARHVGPMAQDFYALFGFGESDTGISTMDTSGVALAAIKALADRNDALVARDEALTAMVADMALRLEALEAPRD